MWNYLFSFITFSVFAQTATISATIVPTIVSTPTPTKIPTTTPLPTSLPLTISNLPSQVTKGQEFTVNLNLHTKINQSYQLKIYGGVNGDNYSFEVQNLSNWINGYNGSWDSLPQITTDSDGNSHPQINLRFKTDKTSGTCQLVAKIKETSGNTYLLSPIYNLDVIDPPPPTSTPTKLPPTPTDLPPTSTNAPVPTNISTPTKTVTPTLTPTPTIFPTIEPTPTTIIIPSINLNIQTITPSIASNSPVTDFNFLPHILVGVGSLLLLVPLLVAKLGQ